MEGTNVFTCKLAAQLSKAEEREEGGRSAELARGVFDSHKKLSNEGVVLFHKLGVGDIHKFFLKLSILIIESCPYS